MSMVKDRSPLAIDAPVRARRWNGVLRGTVLTLLGCWVGLLTLPLAAMAYLSLPGPELFWSYFSHPWILILNLLPPVGLMWLFYLLSRRGWVGYLGGAVPFLALAVANYYKIRLRGDPVLGADLLLVTEAGGILGNYTLEFSRSVCLVLVCGVLGLLVALVLLPKRPMDWPLRLVGPLAIVLAAVPLLLFVYFSPAVYEKVENGDLINPWAEVEVYSSKGVIYPFLHSCRDMLPSRPKGYDRDAAAAALGAYTDADIPADRRVNVVGVMLEAFADLTTLEGLSDYPGVAEVYAPWRDLAREGVSGQLLTNIFAGGTVDTEWSFLTGFSQYDDFRVDTDSYVWYLRDQGYRTQGGHPGYGWFYNRQNINRYLGFQEYWFTENHYGALVDPVTAAWHSDDVLVREILSGAEDVMSGGENVFSFSVSYQNHGPYEEGDSAGKYLPASAPLSASTRNIVNNYLKGIDATLQSMADLAQGLEEMDEPVVLVLFGDHKPWMGNGNSAYLELGADFSLEELESFESYYATPYLIWANSAARQVLGDTFVPGDGEDISPCFLMNEVFALLGWEGPAFLQLSDETRARTPLVHQSGRYLEGGELVPRLSDESQKTLETYLQVQYYRQRSGRADA